MISCSVLLSFISFSELNKRINILIFKRILRPEIYKLANKEQNDLIRINKSMTIFRKGSRSHGNIYKDVHIGDLPSS